MEKRVFGAGGGGRQILYATCEKMQRDEEQVSQSLPGTALLYALFGWASSSSLLAQFDFPSSLELVCCFLYVFFFPHSLHPITHGWNSTAPSAPSQSLTHVHSGRHR